MQKNLKLIYTIEIIITTKNYERNYCSCMYIEYDNETGSGTRNSE